MKGKTKRYAAICGHCYKCYLGFYTSRREANREAVSHMNAYHHDTWVRDTKDTAAQSRPTPA